MSEIFSGDPERNFPNEKHQQNSKVHFTAMTSLRLNS
jgi:hypothetical protein